MNADRDQDKKDRDKTDYAGPRTTHRMASAKSPAKKKRATGKRAKKGRASREAKRRSRR
jgi:hypothetical protein